MSSRRSFLSRFGIGSSALGAALGLGSASALAQSGSDSRFQPARHSQDDWLDQIPGKHRCFFDTTTADELADAIQFAGNYITGSRNGYALEPGDLALIIGMRHEAAPFAFTDAMWSKHGVVLSKRAKWVDPKTSQPALGNPRQTQLNNLAKRGVRFTVCDLSTHAIAGLIADSISGKADEVYPQLIANRVDSARQVPAGIVALNRAQEHGYSTM
jgi:intracellular sulfur oxidation DsrE/DsrF family protein